MAHSVEWPRIVRGENDILIAEDGRRYIDLFSSHGAAFLGHAHPGVVAALSRQAEALWITGGLSSPTVERAKAEIETFFPRSHQVAALYSTGMEAVEFALRVARVCSGRRGVIGFERSMHGKSLATAYLGWDNRDGIEVPGFHRLPFVPTLPEEEILRRVERHLAREPISAVLVEPIQGSGGGHMASREFYQALARLVRSHQALLVFDEILTGFYRTGPAFVLEEMAVVPDIVLIGKAMGSGFPVSAVVADRRYPIVTAMLPGSTYAGNPLAAAAILATLECMRSLDLPRRVAAIERVVRSALGALISPRVALRGKGAFWILELSPEVDAEAVAIEIYRAGVAIGCAEHLLRILPAATIEPDNLARACAVVRETVRRTVHAQS